MSWLPYAAGGLASGMVQGKQLQFEHKNVRFEQGLKNRQLAQEGAYQQRQGDIAQHEQDMANLNKLDSIVKDPNFKTNYNPDQQADFLHQRMGFLRGHPNLDFGGEVKAADDRATNAYNSADQVSNDILSNPTGYSTNPDIAAGMNPSVASQGQPAPAATPAATPAPAPSQGLPPINGAAQAGPVQPQTPNVPAPPVSPKAGLDVQLGPGSPAVPGSPDGASNQFIINAGHYDQMALDPQWSPAQQEHFRELASQNRIASANLQETLAKTGVESATAKNLGVQTALAEPGVKYADESARAAVHGTEAATVKSKAEAHLADVNAGILPREATVHEREAATGEFNARVNAADALARAAFQKGDLTLRDKQVQQDAARMGLTAQQMKFEQQKGLAEMAKMHIDTATALGLPGFMGKAFKQGVIDNAWVKNQVGAMVPGPSNADWVKMRQEEGLGTSPADYDPNESVGWQDLAHQAKGAGAAPTHGQSPSSGAAPHSFLGNLGNRQGIVQHFLDRNGAVDQAKLNAYLTDPRDDASTKVNVYKILGIKVPNNLRDAAANQQGGGFRKSGAVQ